MQNTNEKSYYFNFREINYFGEITGKNEKCKHMQMILFMCCLYFRSAARFKSEFNQEKQERTPFEPYQRFKLYIYVYLLYVFAIHFPTDFMCSLYIEESEIIHRKIGLFSQPLSLNIHIIQLSAF